LLSLYILISIFDNTYIFTEGFIERSLAFNPSENALPELIAYESKTKWIGFLLIPLLLIVKILFATFLISCGVVFFDEKYSFRYIFKACMFSEFVFLLSHFLYSINLFVNRENLTIETAGNYFPFSFFSLIGAENVHSDWIIYPLQTINLFEVFYMASIAWFLSKKSKQSFVDTFGIVLPSYGLGLLLWITLVAFLTFQIT
jgi:hypothetical protein